MITTLSEIDPIQAPLLRLHDGFEGTSPHRRHWIMILQGALNDYRHRVRPGGKPLEVDGLFGRRTEKAVEELQKDAGLDDDGIVGPQTWLALQSAVLLGEFPEDRPILFATERKITDSDVRRMVLWAEEYATEIDKVAREFGVDPAIIFGIGARETAWGHSRSLDRTGPAGRGDRGHGHGLIQIDDRYHRPFIKTGKWKNALENLRYGIGTVWIDYGRQLAKRHGLTGLPLIRATCAAYNAGPGNVSKAIDRGHGVDYYTTGRDYAADVLSWAGVYQADQARRKGAEDV
jgi:hypothetical protein